MKKTYTTIQNVIDEVCFVLGEQAKDYDVFTIADQLSWWEGEDLVADVDCDEFWPLVESNELVRDDLGLPEGIDSDVRGTIEDATCAIRTHLPYESISRYLRYTASRDTWPLRHLIIRAKAILGASDHDVSHLERENEMLEDYERALALCECKHADPRDSRTLCRALHIVETEQSFEAAYILASMCGNSPTWDPFAGFSLDC